MSTNLFDVADRLWAAIEMRDHALEDAAWAALNLIAAHAPQGTTSVRFRFGFIDSDGTCDDNLIRFDSYLDADGNLLVCDIDIDGAHLFAAWRVLACDQATFFDAVEMVAPNTASLTAHLPG